MLKPIDEGVVAVALTFADPETEYDELTAHVDMARVTDTSGTEVAGVLAVSLPVVVADDTGEVDMVKQKSAALLAQNLSIV